MIGLDRRGVASFLEFVCVVGGFEVAERINAGLLAIEAADGGLSGAAISVMVWCSEVIGMMVKLNTISPGNDEHACYYREIPGRRLLSGEIIVGFQMN